MSTITTKSWCAVDLEHHAHIGNKAEIVRSIFTITWVDTPEGRHISATVRKSRQAVTLPTYSPKISHADVRRQVIEDLFEMVPRLGFTIYYRKL